MVTLDFFAESCRDTVC